MTNSITVEELHNVAKGAASAGCAGVNLSREELDALALLLAATMHQAIMQSSNRQLMERLDNGRNQGRSIPP